MALPATSSARLRMVRSASRCFWSGAGALVRPLFCALRRHLSRAPGWCSRRIPWAPWSVVGSAMILFAFPIFRFEVSVAINSWYGPFYDLVQAALFEIEAGHGRAILRRIVDLRRHRPGRGRGRRDDAVSSSATTSSRWRTAMNDFYTAKLAATAHHRRRFAAGAGGHHGGFATTMEGLGDKPDQCGADAFWPSCRFS